MTISPTGKLYLSQSITVRGRVVVDDDLLGDDVDNQCVGRCHVEAAWLSDDANTSIYGEILVQGQVDDGCDLERKKNKQKQFNIRQA